MLIVNEEVMGLSNDEIKVNSFYTFISRKDEENCVETLRKYIISNVRTMLKDKLQP